MDNDNDTLTEEQTEFVLRLTMGIEKNQSDSLSQC